EVNEKQSRLDLSLARGAVDVERDVVSRHGYAPCARATAFARARAVRTRAISFLYSTEPRRSADGDVACAASFEAAAIASASGFLPFNNCSAAVALIGVGPTLVRTIPTFSIVPLAPSVTCAAAAAVAKSPTLRSSFM